jgi:AcrR family transcriptional regulator
MPAARDDPPRSSYRSPLRARQAAQTRQTVLAAASRLFTQRGWAATTIAAVAAEAGTAVETVYAGFGSKSGLLTAAIDVALVGDDQPVPLAERPQYAQLGVGDRWERLGSAAHLVALIHERSVPLLRALQEAAASDPAAAARWQRYEADRRTEIARGLGLVLGRRPSDRLVDAIWAIAGPEVFAKLVLDRGWSLQSYQRWLVDTVTALTESRRR